MSETATVIENGMDCPNRCGSRAHVWPLRNGYVYYECRHCRHTGYRRFVHLPNAWCDGGTECPGHTKPENDE